MDVVILSVTRLLILSVHNFFLEFLGFVVFLELILALLYIVIEIVVVSLCFVYALRVRRRRRRSCLGKKRAGDKQHCSHE